MRTVLVTTKATSTGSVRTVFDKFISAGLYFEVWPVFLNFNVISALDGTL